MKTSLLKPSPRHEHVYAVVRFDADADPATPIDLRVTVKKVVRDPRFADSEAKRLNALNGDKGSYYFVQVTRLEHEPAVDEPLRGTAVHSAARSVQPQKSNSS